MDGLDDFVGVTTPLNPKGWLKVFGNSFSNYKKDAIIVFLSGIFALVLEMASFAVLLLGLKLFAEGGSVSLLGITLETPMPPRMMAYGLIIFVVLRLIASTVLYYSQVVIAKVRAESFRDYIERAIRHIQKYPDHEYIRSLGLKGSSRVLRRECRYASRTITDALQLPRHIFTLIILLALGLWAFPIAVALIVLIMVLSYPFHRKLGKWGVKVMENVLDYGAEKSKYDRQVIGTVLRSPFSTQDEGAVDDIPLKHSRSPIVSKFLLAYENRVKLPPRSQLITNLSFLLIFMIIGGIALLQYQVGEVDVVLLTALLIGIRLASAAVVQAFTSITVIASYSPLISDFLDFLDTTPKVPLKDSLEIVGGKFLSHKACIICPNEFDVAHAKEISNFWLKPVRDNIFIHGKYDELPLDFDGSSIKNALQADGAWEQMSDPMKDRIKQSIENFSAASEASASLIAAWYNSERNWKTNVFWDARSFGQLIPDDQKLVEQWLRNRRLAIYYANVPKSVPELEGLGVWLLQPSKLQRLCRADGFREKRNEIISLVNSL